MDNGATDWLPITIRYRGKCVECGKEMTSGLALWSKSTKAIRHLDCSAKSADRRAASSVKSESIEPTGRYSQAVLLKCFICGKEEYQYDEYYLDGYYGKRRKSISYICKSCLEKRDVFETYRQTFLRKVKNYNI